MAERKRENAVKNLVNLYTVVIGVALSLAVTEVLQGGRGLEGITLSDALLFVAFIGTLVPFYHGALRHLDDAYVENQNDHIKDGALVIDFVLLFLHAVAFMLLALLIRKPSHFAWVLIVILSIDVLWGVFAHFASSSRGEFSAESKWTVINFFFVGVSTWYLIGNDIYLSTAVEPIKLAIPIWFVCILRSMVDYIWCRKFYFPR